MSYCTFLTWTLRWMVDIFPVTLLRLVELEQSWMVYCLLRLGNLVIECALALCCGWCSNDHIWFSKPCKEEILVLTLTKLRGYCILHFFAFSCIFFYKDSRTVVNSYGQYRHQQQ
jgi:hypothetical protein